MPYWLGEIGTFHLTQVAIYNYMKLQLLRAKASMSTGKDVEKLGGERQALLSNKTLLNTDTIEVAADSGTHASKEGAHRFSQIRWLLAHVGRLCLKRSLPWCTATGSLLCLVRGALLACYSLSDTAKSLQRVSLLMSLRKGWPNAKSVSGRPPILAEEQVYVQVKR